MHHELPQSLDPDAYRQRTAEPPVGASVRPCRHITSRRQQLVEQVATGNPDGLKRVRAQCRVWLISLAVSFRCRMRGWWSHANMALSAGATCCTTRRRRSTNTRPNQAVRSRRHLR